MNYGLYFAGGIASYVIDLKLAESHIVTCELALFLKDEDFMIQRCESPTANVSGIRETGSFAKLGLPVKPKF